MLSVDPIQRGHIALEREMVRIGKDAPVEFGLVVPLALLADLATHKEQLLARSRPLVAEQKAQASKLLPGSPGDLASSEFFPWTTSSCESGST